ncbi:MAG: hypothetical protein WKF92_00320 [Pyrinomonadaceae bacterium]
MWNRIYLTALVVFLIPLVFFTYYSYSWLTSIGSPRAASEGFLYHNDFAWNLLWFSTVLLLVLANVVLAKYRKSWAIWTTFVYFATFVVIQYLWLQQSYLQFSSESGLADSDGSFSPVFAVLLSAGAAVVLFADQLLVSRMSDRLYPAVTEPSSEEVDLDANAEKEPEN